MGMSIKVPAVPVGVTDADVQTALNGGGAIGVRSKNSALMGGYSPYNTYRRCRTSLY